jgi:hypothetical protein
MDFGKNDEVALPALQEHLERIDRKVLHPNSFLIGHHIASNI